MFPFQKDMDCFVEEVSDTNSPKKSPRSSRISDEKSLHFFRGYGYRVRKEINRMKLLFH